MKKPCFLEATDNKIHKSWNIFLTKEIIQLLHSIESEIKNDTINPETKNVLRFLEQDLEKIKILILGQDPYPQNGAATGRAFEVGNLESWLVPFRNISLKNIVRAIYQSEYGKTMKFAELKEKIEKGSFPIKAPDQLFESWSQQGVLLLNTSFTCKAGQPGSHAHVWKPFTKKLLEFIAVNRSDIIWFLWGNHAINITSDIPVKNKLETMHPMMCYASKSRPGDFLFGEINPFKSTSSIINWMGN